MTTVQPQSNNMSDTELRWMQEWTMSKLLTILIGLCCVFSAIFNVLYAHNITFDTALHSSMREFKQRRPSKGLSAKELIIQENELRNVHTEQVDVERVDQEGEEVSSSSASSKIAGLSCQKYGGPSDKDAQELVYWHDIPSDNKYVSPFHIKDGQHRRYMTFEPDGGGWNNIRMAMETVVGLAIATGRTLVMPPEQRMYLLAKNKGKDKTDFSFADFFPMHELAHENAGLEIITTQEFLEKEAMAGNLRDKYTKEVSFPPENRTDWNGQDVKALKEWLRNVTLTPLWSPSECMAAFPSSTSHDDIERLRSMFKSVQHLHREFLEEPTPVDAQPIERMQENLSGRKKLCIYDEEMQSAFVVHFMCYHKMHVRMLVHFYAFLFFEDWREDLWMKRFMRDHMRYIDEIQCAAARVVKAMRDISRSHGNGGEFDSFHIRRGDFQFTKTRISAQEIYENTKELLSPNSTIFIATDEKDKKFFDPLRKHYNIKFMDDFNDVLTNVNSNYYGMIDQLVASRGRKFFGCWHSTFTGFIARMRGYHSVNEKAAGYEKGLLLNTYYYTPLSQQTALHRYAVLHGAFFNREFPTSWRDIDKSIGNLPNTLQDEIRTQ